MESMVTVMVTRLIFWFLWFTLNTPLQTHGRKDHEFVYEKVEPCSCVALSKDICNLLKCGQMMDLNVTVKYLFSNKMDIYLNMFGAGMEYWVRGQCKSS
jgi:hypothetical protein